MTAAHQPATTPARILVVEDNANLALGLRNNLEIEGYAVDVARDGVAALDMARASAPDLVILDLMLPGLDGYRVLEALRAEGRDMPVLILTARGEEAEKVLGFRLGADDYVTKPFGLMELLARVRTHLRRAAERARRADAGDGAAPAVVRFGDVEVEPATYVVRRGGAPCARPARSPRRRSAPRPPTPRARERWPAG